jgi:hypothetical protein
MCPLTIPPLIRHAAQDVGSPVQRRLPMKRSKSSGRSLIVALSGGD